MYCPEISQSLQVLLIAINIFIVGSLVPTVILNSEKTIRYTSVVILLITILITAAQVLIKKKIEKHGKDDIIIIQTKIKGVV